MSDYDPKTDSHAPAACRISSSATRWILHLWRLAGLCGSLLFSVVCSADLSCLYDMVVCIRDYKTGGGRVKGIGFNRGMGRSGGICGYRKWDILGHCLFGYDGGYKTITKYHPKKTVVTVFLQESAGFGTPFLAIRFYFYVFILGIIRHLTRTLHVARTTIRTLLFPFSLAPPFSSELTLTFSC
jgi:hypothetical protein